MDAPRDTPVDLAERYRQLRPFDDAESALVRSLIQRPGRLPLPQETALRQALNLARLWVVEEFPTGPLLGSFRDRLLPLAESMTRRGSELDPEGLASDAVQLLPLLLEKREAILQRYAGRLLPSALDHQLTHKALVLVLGGGGGCGYVHLGAFSALQSMGIVPDLIVGSSIGSVLGLFRAREIHFRDAMIRAVTGGLSFRKLFRIFESESKFGLPGTLRLYLRSALSRFFTNGEGDTMRIKDMAIPFICVVTGIRREALRGDIHAYERAFTKQLGSGAFGALLHLKQVMTSWTGLLSELASTPGGMKPIALGGDAETREFDVLDAVGFSCAVPALIHYDILRDDPRMNEMMKKTLSDHDVHYFVDGGISANVPSRFAWESVQRGRIGTRNALILGMDCFAPQMGRNVLYLPLMRMAAENVARDRPFAHEVFTYRRVLSPAELVPSGKAVRRAVESGRQEFEALGTFLRKMLEPISPL